MSDYENYNDNLAFEPKSADDLNKQGRQSEVLIKAIEKCEKLEKEIIALKKEYKAECNRADELEDSLNTSWQNESKLKELLKEAKDIIEWYKADCGYKDVPTEAILTKIDNAIGVK